MKRVVAVCVAAVVVWGCKSHPLLVCVSPRVTGRVLAADTGQPLAGVKVRSGVGSEGSGGTAPIKGGEAVKAKGVVRTDRDGRFVLESERALSPLGGAGWLGVELTFERAGYERFWTNYSYINLSTNSGSGEAALSAGDIWLRPKRK